MANSSGSRCGPGWARRPAGVRPVAFGESGFRDWRHDRGCRRSMRRSRRWLAVETTGRPVPEAVGTAPSVTVRPERSAPLMQMLIFLFVYGTALIGTVVL